MLLIVGHPVAPVTALLDFDQAEPYAANSVSISNYRYWITLEHEETQHHLDLHRSTTIR
jgi:hypothetical protein